MYVNGCVANFVKIFQGTLVITRVLELLILGICRVSSMSNIVYPVKRANFFRCPNMDDSGLSFANSQILFSINWHSPTGSNKGPYFSVSIFIKIAGCVKIIII